MSSPSSQLATPATPAIGIRILDSSRPIVVANQSFHCHIRCIMAMAVVSPLENLADFRVPDTPESSSIALRISQ